MLFVAYMVFTSTAVAWAVGALKSISTRSSGLRGGDEAILIYLLLIFLECILTAKILLDSCHEHYPHIVLIIIAAHLSVPTSKDYFGSLENKELVKSFLTREIYFRRL